MEIDFAIIADSADVANGKLYLLGGGWDKFYAQSFPQSVRLAVALGVLVPWDQCNERIPIKMLIRDADGHPVGPEMTAQIEVGRPPGIAPGSTQRAVLAINSVFPIQQPGRYEILIAADGKERSMVFEAILGGKPR